MRTILIGFLIVAQLLVASCAQRERPAPQERNTESASAIGSRVTFDATCSADMPGVLGLILDGVNLGRFVASTPEFEQCVAAADYLPCTDDMSTSKADAVAAARANNALNIHCSKQPGVLAMTAQDMDPTYSGTLQVSVTPDLLRLSDSSDRARVVASVLWHESMHVFGWKHPQAGRASCWPYNGNRFAQTMPYLIDKCMEETAELLVKQAFTAVMSQPRGDITDPYYQRPTTYEMRYFWGRMGSGYPSGIWSKDSFQREVVAWLEGPDVEIHFDNGSVFTGSDLSPVAGHWRGLPSFVANAQQAPERTAWRLSMVSPSDPSKGFLLHDIYSGYCVRALSAFYDVEHVQCTDRSPAHIWDIEVVDSGLYRLRSRSLPTKCLGASNTAGSPIQVVECGSFESYLSISPRMTHTASYALASPDGLACVDVPNDSSSDGTYLQTYPCHGGRNQQWRFESPPVAFVSISPQVLVPADGIWKTYHVYRPNYQLYGNGGGRCVATETPWVRQYSCDGRAAEIFQMDLDADGAYTLRTANNTCLTRATTTPAWLRIETCTEAENQRWRLFRNN